MPRVRALWSEDNLAAAIRSVQRGSLSTYAASKRYGIPRRTIRNHIESGSLKKSLGRKSVLTKEQEDDLVTRIIRFAEIGLPITPKILRHQVYKFCELHNIRHSFSSNTKLAGKDWFKAFMERHPEISRRKAQFMNPARVQKLNKFIVNDHFNKLRQIYDELDLKYQPARIYNMDEKGCRLTIHHQQTVVAQKGAKRVHLQSSEHAETVTIAGCVNALGNAIPPMIIFKGKRLKPELSDNLPPGTLVEKSPKGYMTNELFKEFLKHLAKYKSPGKVLLIFDGAACHLDLSIVDIAESLDIRLYCLPSNTTHELQPLDKAVYRSFEHHWDTEVLSFLDQHPDKKITKARFNIIFSNVWSKCMTHNNITSGFKATGLFPFNPAIIPETAFAPSILSEIPMQMVSDSNDENVPISNSPKPCSSRAASISAANVRPVQTPVNRTEKSYYRMVCSSDSDYSDEDIVPLSQLTQRTPFQEFMPTPVKTVNKTPIVRKKALNYRETSVTKELFKQDKKNSTKSKTRKDDDSSPRQVGWFCYKCEEDKIADMRQCAKCGKWYHEDCVGLSAEDVEEFECPDGC